jgi:antitoxin YefM
MAIQTTYTQARASLASLLDQVTKNREVVIIQRRGEEDVAMISADELMGILETAHLLRSPNNTKRLLSTLDRVRKESGTPQTIDELRTEVGLEWALQKVQTDHETGIRFPARIQGGSALLGGNGTQDRPSNFPTHRSDNARAFSRHR